MAKKKIYAVKVGRQTGIFYDWDSCKNSVAGYPNALYKGFENEKEANEYLGSSNQSINENEEKQKVPTMETNGTFCFVDGSFNPKTKVYGYGGFVSHNGEIHYISGCGNDEEMASMRNVAGEVLGSMAAIKKAIELGIKDLTIYYDYMGIEQWATKGWKRNKKGTIEYSNFCDSVKDKINLSFVHVYGHTGIEGNEKADELAKKAVGLEIKKIKEKNKQPEIITLKNYEDVGTLEEFIVAKSIMQEIPNIIANLEYEIDELREFIGQECYDINEFNYYRGIEKSKRDLIEKLNQLIGNQ